MYDRRPASTAASAVPTVPKPDAATLGSFQLAIVILHHRPEHSDRGDNIGVFRRAFKRNRISRPAGAAGGGVAAAKGYAGRHHVRPPPVRRPAPAASRPHRRSEEHTSELQSLMRISYAVFCLKKKKSNNRLTQ